jgi:hypothetical protein
LLIVNYFDPTSDIFAAIPEARLRNRFCCGE